MTIATSPNGVSDFQRTEIEYADHAAGAGRIEEMFKVPSSLLRNGEGWAVEYVTRLGTHNTTHVDAPWHYNSAIQGKPSPTIDELPLEWFYGDGVILDMRYKADGDPITPSNMEAELRRIGYEIEALDIVLIRTGRDAFHAEPDYMHRGPGVTAEGTRWLYDQGVRVMGIDAWGWDAPLRGQAEKAIASNAPGVFWAAHQCDLAYSQIERLTNLGAVPKQHGFKVACFPLKIRRGSAAPARVVAIMPEGEGRKSAASGKISR